MATATEVRAWAVAEGNATSRGKLRADVITDWNNDHPDDPYEPGPPREGLAGHFQRFDTLGRGRVRSSDRSWHWAN